MNHFEATFKDGERITRSSERDYKFAWRYVDAGLW